MKPTIDSDHALLGAYVVGALDDMERVAFERHIAACESCSVEAADLSDTAAALADAEAVPPPLSLRASVTAQVARTAQSPRTSRPAFPTPAGRRRWLVVVAAAASFVAVAGIGVAFGARGVDVDTAALERDIMMLSSAPDAHAIDLELGASHVVMSARMDEVAVLGHGAPLPADGMEYQLWFVMEDGREVAGPTFMPDKSGDIMALARADCGAISTFTVTVEPHGGSRTPTGDPVASVDV